MTLLQFNQAVDEVSRTWTTRFTLKADGVTDLPDVPVMFWKHVNPLLKSGPDHHVDMPEDGGANVPQNELVKDLPAVHQQLVLRVLVRVGIYPKSASCNNIDGHLLVNVFHLDQVVLLGHFLQVVDHLVDAALQQLQHSLDLS